MCQKINLMFINRKEHYGIVNLEREIFDEFRIVRVISEGALKLN